ncbi:unnamed protein product, partial [Laminaria digitata]
GTFRQNAKYSDTGSPAGHIGRGLGAIRALWSAWRALKVFFPAGVDKSISRGFYVRRPPCMTSSLNRSHSPQNKKTRPPALETFLPRDKFDTPSRQARHPTQPNMAQAAPGTPTTNTNSIALDEECPRCDRPLRLLENNNPGRADFPGCPGYPNDCAWTGIQLSWSKPCAYCCETLPAGATSWSRKLEGEF